MERFRNLNRELGMGIGGVYGVMRKEWVGIALAAGSMLSSLFGGLASRNAQKKAERELRAKENRENAWYMRRYNENYADTASGRATINEAKDYARENWKKASGAAAVTNGTDAATAQAKNAGNKMVGNAVRNIAAQDTARKDNVDSVHMKMQDNFASQRIANAEQRASNVASTAAGMSNALGSMAQSVGGDTDLGGKKNSGTKTYGTKTQAQVNEWFGKHRYDL